MFIDAYEHALAGLPRAGNRVGAHVVDHLLVDPLGRAAKGKLAQGGEISRHEVVANGLLGLGGHIDFALHQPLDQVFGREIDQLHFVGAIENGIRHRLAHMNAGNLRHHVVEAFNVLNVQSGVDVDAGGEQLFHVHVALGMTAAGRIGVGELINQHEARAALQDGVQVHLRKHLALIEDALLGDALESLGQQFGLNAAMRFDDADDRIDAVEPAVTCLRQHFIGLPDTRRGTKENLEPATPLGFLRCLLQQRLGRWPRITVVPVLSHERNSPRRAVYPHLGRPTEAFGLSHATHRARG